MNAKDLLNMDLQTAIQLLLRGWRWWIDELSGMLPLEWRERLSRKSHVVAEIEGDTLVYRKEESGTPLAERPRGPVKFLMPANRVLLRRLDLPLLPMSDVRRMVALDIDRLTPFQADQVYFDAEVTARDPESGRQQVTLGFLPRDTANKFLDYARQNNLQPAAIGVAPRDGVVHDFDFLSAMRDAHGGDAAQRRSLYWWAAAGVLLVLNLALLTWRDTNRLDELRQAVEAQQAPVSVALRTREKVDRETARRADLLAKKQRSSPLPVLEAVTKAMPQDAWVKRFEWNGRAVHVIGYRKTSSDILARLEASPVLRNARSLITEVRNSDAAASQQFDMSAERQTGGGR
ncbi:MAG TPA: PilN domain-containing protein [Rhizomicrobium sp.]|jgi:general secretion pathway protein L|nr:PilN domain-containing protein [Rhizomicrobium sp.]